MSPGGVGRQAERLSDASEGERPLGKTRTGYLVPDASQDAAALPAGNYTVRFALDRDRCRLSDAVADVIRELRIEDGRGVPI
jgi:hypothetical protein